MPTLHRDRIAAIDVGTNSVKLLVADVSAESVDPVVFRRETSRIGAGIGRTRRVKPANLTATTGAIARFVRAARRAGSSKTVAFSTYALRTAVNAPAVLRAIEQSAGIKVRVLSGREEARFAYLSACRHSSRSRPCALVFDVGGGSTELVLGCSGSVETWTSLPLGALALTERFLHADPISTREYDALCHYITRRLSKWFASTSLPEPARLGVVASGGTVTTARSMSMADSTSQHAPLTYAMLRSLEARCLALSTAQRKRLPGLATDRADIIPAGVAVVLAILRLARKRVVDINPGGVREGVLIHLAQNRLQW